MSKRDILVVFDIDETLLQYINKNAYKYWEGVTREQKSIIEKKLDIVDLGEEKRKIIMLRPGLKEFLEMARDSGRIKVAIWTYSEREYAKDIGELICNKYNLESDMFIFKYGAEDIEDDDIPKSMQQIWDNPKFGRKFNKFNTFIVDDRYGNVCHKVNRYNSILVQGFAPFGETKAREPLTDELLERAVNDNIFHELSEISKKILKDIDGCEDEEIDEAFKSEAVFVPKCMRRKGLDSYVKDYEKGIQLCTIGKVENAASAFKGGRRRRSRRMSKIRSMTKIRSMKKNKKGGNKNKSMRKRGKKTRRGY